tara:strand:+ start:195 stop:500 length:306 start_codon:yes stop_codon:yes gene_type:complete
MRIERLIGQILETKFSIYSETTLQSQLKRFNIPFDPSLSSYCWLHNLFKKNKDNIENLEEYGVSVNTEFAKLPLGQLIATVDAELQLLSDAHQERYFKTRK